MAQEQRTPLTEEERQQLIEEIRRRRAEARGIPETPERTPGQEALGTASRVAGTTAPMWLRLGSGLAAGTVSNIPLAGIPLGFLLGAGGEALAQKIEGEEDLNWKRVGFEGALGAIPGAKLIRAGQVGKSALLGGTAAAGGVVGRKATDEDPETSALDPSQYGLWDAGQVAGGALLGGLIGKLAGRTPKQNTTPYGPEPLDDFLRGKKWDTQQVQLKAAELESKGQKEAAHGLRVAARNAGIQDKSLLDDITKYNDKEITQQARNLQAGDRAQIQQERAASEILSEAQKQEQAQQRWIQQYERELERLQREKNAGAAANIEVMEAQARKLADEDAARQVQTLREGLEPQAPTVKETYSAPNEAGGKDTATIVHRAPKDETGPPAPRPLSGRPTSLESSGKAVMTKERAQQLIGQDPEDAVKRGVLVKEGDGYRIKPAEKKSRATTPAGGALPKQPVTPKPGVYQIVRKDGTVVEAADEKAAEALVNAAGPGTAVIPPSDLPKPPKTKLKGTATDIVEQRRAQQPSAAPSPAAPTPAAPPKAPTAEVPPPAPEPPKTPAAPAAPAAPPAQPPTAALDLPEGVSLPVPLAMEVAKAQADVPAGSVIARFFPNQGAALKAGAYAEELPDNVIGMLTPLLGRAEASQALGRAGAKAAGTKVKDHPLSDAGGRLWNLIQRLSGELDLPKFTPGSNVRPNLKHVPEGLRVAGKVDTPGPVAKPAPEAPKAPVVETPAGPKSLDEMTIDELRERYKDGFPTGPKPEVPEGLPPPKPIPAELQARIDAAINKQKILEQSGRAGTDEFNKLGEELAQLQHERFATEYPELAAQMARAEQAAKAKPKGRGGPKISANPFADPASIAWAAQKLGPEGVGALAGGGIGAAADEDNRWRGAALGAGIGYGAGKGLGKLGSQLGDTRLPESGLPELAASAYRFNLLTNPASLATNVFAAPYGAAGMGAIERMLTGLGQRAGLAPVDDSLETGFQALRNLRPDKHFSERFSLDDAKRLLHSELERGEKLWAEAAPGLEKVLTAPGTGMLAGDLAARKALMEAGVPEQIARRITLTHDARTQLGEGILNFARTSGAGGTFLLPFSRTAVNIFESSLERIPGLGLITNKIFRPEFQKNWAEIAAQQGLGAATAFVSYQIGQELDPNWEYTPAVMRLISNMAGQYGSVAQAGIVAGMRDQYGDSVGEKFSAAGRSLIEEMPLPSTQSAQTIINAVSRGWPAGPIDENAEHFPQRWMPRGALPGIATDDGINMLKDLGGELQTLMYGRQQRQGQVPLR